MKNIYSTYNKLANHLNLPEMCKKRPTEKWTKDKQGNLQKKKLKCPINTKQRYPT